MSIKEELMDTLIYSLQEFMIHSKNITYLMMGAALILTPLFWFFLTGRDEKKDTF